jgi:hypothetical protein
VSVVQRPLTLEIITIADCSDLTIVPTWTWMGLPAKGSAVSRSEQSRPISEGHEGGARLVAASRRSTGGEHAWVSLDIGIAYVLVEPTAKVIVGTVFASLALAAPFRKSAAGSISPTNADCSDLLSGNSLCHRLLSRRVGTITSRNNRRCSDVGTSCRIWRELVVRQSRVGVVVDIDRGSPF